MAKYSAKSSRSGRTPLAASRPDKYVTPPMHAVSFEATARSPAGVRAAALSALQKALSSVKKPSAALIFCSGGAATRMKEMAEAARQIIPETLPLMFLSGPGVLTERRELENETATSGLVFSGGKAELRFATKRPLTCALIEQQLEASSGKPTLLFLRSERFDPDELWGVRSQRGTQWVYGAGTHGNPGIICVERRHVTAASMATLTLNRSLRPVIKTAHSCRLLHPLMPITRADRGMVLELEGRPALSCLREIGAGLEGQPLVFTVIADSTDEPVDMLVRGIHGIDPDRQGLLVGTEVREGAYLSFGVRDAAAAREDLVGVCRTVGRQLAGAEPRFGLYFNCSGRGLSLHGSQNVDTRVIRSRFPNLPLAGFQSAFEIAPFEQAPALQLYTGVLSIFGSPS